MSLRDRRRLRHHLGPLALAVLVLAAAVVVAIGYPLFILGALVAGAVGVLLAQKLVFLRARWRTPPPKVPAIEGEPDEASGDDDVESSMLLGDLLRKQRERAAKPWNRPDRG